MFGVSNNMWLSDVYMSS